MRLNSLSLKQGKYSLFLCSLLIIMSGRVLGAYWLPNGTPVCTLTTSQRSPAIASDGAGGAIIVWKDLRNGHWDLYAQRLDMLGTIQWAVDGVPICTATGYQENCEIISDGNYGAIMVWRDDRGTDSDLYAQRINADGTIQWAVDGVVVSAGPSNQLALKIIPDATGGVVIAWADYRAGNYEFDIYAQKLDENGNAQWTTDGVPICTATDSQTRVQLTTDGSGGAIIAWHDERSTGWDIYAQRIAGNGTVQWISDGVAICIACEGTGSGFYPELVPDGDGGAIITWHDYRDLEWDIYAQRVDAAGSPRWTSDGIAICTASGSQEWPESISDDEGGAIITWNDQRGTDSDTYAQRIDENGTPLWMSDGAPVCTAPGGQGKPQIVADQSGGAIIVWLDGRGGYLNDNIYSQRIDDSGDIMWDVSGIAVCAASENQAEFRLASDGSGGSVIAWRDYRNLNTDIYAQLITADGYVPLGILPGSELPLTLHQNVPNPFNPSTAIRYTVGDKGGEVSLGIYDMSGHLIKNLVNGTEIPGDKLVIWGGKNGRGESMSSGVYFYRLIVSGQSLTKKMVLLK